MTPVLSGPSGLRLLYLGFAFPPGVQELHPGENPAGHALETQMISHLRGYFEIRSAGVLPFVPPPVEGANPETGIAHEVVLLDRPPEIFHRLKSLARLKAQYRTWRAAGWEPDVVLTYNLSPIYNEFLRWLWRQPGRPRLVLLLLDSPSLGQQVPRLKRFRHRFKPMSTPDAEMLPVFDACIGLSTAVERHVRKLDIPFLWMPGGCNPARALADAEFPDHDGGEPVRFGYFGALGAHAGVKPMLDAFLSSGAEATLELCGYGKAAPEIAELAAREPRLRFHGLLSPAGCLRFGRGCDVLLNPRPASHGNENNFASKLFDYALTGRAILTSRLSGVDEVLGPQAFYFDPADFQSELSLRLKEAAAASKTELNRRGAAIQRRVLSQFSWEQQAARIGRFLFRVCLNQDVELEPAQALAA